MASAKKSGKKHNEEDFESFVRESLAKISDNIEGIRKTQSNLFNEVNELKTKVSRNYESLGLLNKQFESLNLKYEKLNGSVFENSERIDDVEDRLSTNKDSIEGLQTKLNEYKERCLHLERYSRDFNLRFLNIPEEPEEDCVDKLQNILYDILGYQANIENAHRTGRRRPGKPRHIIAKFLYRTERRKVFTNRKNLGDNVWIIEDMIKEDVDKKKLYQDLMKKAYLEGKKPRFHHGNLYIDGILHKD